MEVQEAYSNIEKIITYGFLTARISVEGYDLLIKNITDKESKNIKLFINSFDEKNEILHTLSYSIAFLNGINLLATRDYNLEKVLDHIKNLPNLVVLKIIKVINKLNKVYSESIDFLEGFSYSDKSRYLWSVIDLYNRASYTGMRGLDSVGINSVQENWIIINKRLDEESRYEMDFHNAILIVSASNGKGAQSLQKTYTSRSRELKELRDELCKLGHDRNRKKDHDTKRDKWTAPLNTREDLVQELYRQVAGKKDRHDLYMDKWIQDQKNKSESAKNKVVERQVEFRKKIESIEVGSMEPSRSI